MDKPDAEVVLNRGVKYQSGPTDKVWLQFWTKRLPSFTIICLVTTLFRTTRQPPLQPFQGGQRLGFHPAARFENAEEDLDLPALAAPLDAFDDLIEGGELLVGQQTPFDRLHPDGGIDLAGQDAGDRLLAVPGCLVKSNSVVS